MRLYLFAAGRAFGVVALKNYLGLDCEIASDCVGPVLGGA